MLKRHSRLLLLFPLLLGAIIGGVKWKQMHPTPTQFDLQERAFLSKAKFVDVHVEGKKVNIASDEFKDALDNFYLIDLGNDWPSLLSNPRQSAGPDVVIRACDERDNEWSPFAEIHLGSGIPYGASYNERPNAPQRKGPIFAKLHPVTERRFRELVAKHLPAK